MKTSLDARRDLSDRTGRGEVNSVGDIVIS